VARLAATSLKQRLQSLHNKVVWFTTPRGPIDRGIQLALVALAFGRLIALPRIHMPFYV